MEERLQKLISACGLTSRRQAEQWILDGRVTLNGELAQLGQKADLEKDLVCVDEIALKIPTETNYFMLYKPRGYITTLSDDQGRKTVADLMEACQTRVWPVGRLDYQSEGLLFLSNDGAWTQHILHPSHQVEKEYLVWVTGDIAQALPLLSAPMYLDDELLAPAQVKVLNTERNTTSLSITIHQGKNRQIRRMCSQVELKVLRLKRIREGSVRLDPNLKAGEWRPLTPQEISSLKK